MKRKDFEIEVVSNSVRSSIEAEKGGANRVELCDNLYEGGTTPSIGTIIRTKEQTNLDVFPIIRPRGGDFCYSEDEIQSMIYDIKMGQKIGADGFVIGCLKTDGTIDYDNNARLIEAAKGTPVTFHRAFDLSKDPFEALEVIHKLGIRRILTAGQANQAIDGISLLAELVKASGEIEIMPGSAVDESNIIELAKTTKAKAFHVSLRTWHESPMKFRREGIYMGGLKEIPEFAYAYSNHQRIQQLIQQLLDL
jgi:copper homeostasis protein